jgi:hypothetical protein
MKLLARCLRQYRAKRRLARMVKAVRENPRHQAYLKRRQAALKGLGRG